MVANFCKDDFPIFHSLFISLCYLNTSHVFDNLEMSANFLTFAATLTKPATKNCCFTNRRNCCLIFGRNKPTSQKKLTDRYSFPHPESLEIFKTKVSFPFYIPKCHFVFWSCSKDITLTLTSPFWHASVHAVISDILPFLILFYYVLRFFLNLMIL